MRDAARRPRCAAVELPTISELSQEAGITRRCTVSSAVSPVGPDLVGSSVAERERVSPQRARFEGAVRVAHRLAIVFRCPIPPTRGGVSFRGLVSRSLGGVGHASCMHVCAAERPPMLC